MNLPTANLRTSSAFALFVIATGAAVPAALLPTNAHAQATQACADAAYACARAGATEEELNCAHVSWVIQKMPSNFPCRSILAASEHPACRNVASASVCNDAAYLPWSFRIKAIPFKSQGSYPQRTQTVFCSGGERVESMVVRWGPGVPGSEYSTAGFNYVRSIELECTNGTDKPTDWLKIGRHHGRSAAAFTCKPGELMHKLSFKSGAFVDSIQAHCRGVAAKTATPSTSSSAYMGGPGGSFVNVADCGMNPQAFVSGLSVQITSFPDPKAPLKTSEVITGVEVICQ